MAHGIGFLVVFFILLKKGWFINEGGGDFFQVGVQGFWILKKGVDVLQFFVGGPEVVVPVAVLVVFYVGIEKGVG